MSDIGVVHLDLHAKGGGEAVCMNVLESLQADHEVTLLTLTDPDLGALDEFYNTSVGDVDVERAGRLAPWLHRRYGVGYYVLQNALLSRYARRRAADFDLLVSTINELGLPRAIEYVHFPFDWAVNLDADLRKRIFHPTIEEDGAYEALCTAVAGIAPADIRSNLLVANSGWTADAVEAAYGVRPRVLHPPVDTAGFANRPWDEREPGFVTVGRIERSKRIRELIGILDAVRDRGHETHLHVVGPTVDDAYGREVASLAATRPYVHLEGELPRGELVELVCSHRYGIHGKRHEHFGMAVAELAAGGTVPFAPAAGGQQTIVERPDRQLYTSPEDAVEKITRVLKDPSLQAMLRGSPTDIRRRFGRDRFERAFRALVDEALGPADEPVDAPVAVD